MEKCRGCTSTAKCGRDFGTDDSGLSNAGNEYLATARRNHFDGLNEAGRNILANGAQCFYFDIQNARNLVEDVHTCGNLLAGNTAS